MSLKNEDLEIADELRRILKRKEVPSRRDVIREALEGAAKRHGIAVETSA